MRSSFWATPIPWSQAIGTRHRLIHGYAEVDPAALVLTVRESLPALVAALDAILNDTAS